MDARPSLLTRYVRDRRLLRGCATLLFTWDPDKAAENLRKHGIDFREAATAFGDPHSLSVPDPDHSRGEERWLLLGYSAQGRLLVVAHTETGDEIRIIHARAAAKAERKIYEEEP